MKEQCQLVLLIGKTRSCVIFLLYIIFLDGGPWKPNLLSCTCTNIKMDLKCCRLLNTCISYLCCFGHFAPVCTKCFYMLQDVFLCRFPARGGVVLSVILCLHIGHNSYLQEIVPLVTLQWLWGLRCLNKTNKIMVFPNCNFILHILL